MNPSKDVAKIVDAVEFMLEETLLDREVVEIVMLSEAGVSVTDWDNAIEAWCRTRRTPKDNFAWLRTVAFAKAVERRMQE